MAFDWSPGGCCCKKPEIWFDIYTGWKTNTPNGLVRAPTILPRANDPNIVPSDWLNSSQQIGWIIPYTNQSLDRLTIATAVGSAPDSDTEVVWSLEETKASPTAIPKLHASRYNALTKSLLMSIELPTSPTEPNGPIEHYGIMQRRSDKLSTSTGPDNGRAGVSSDRWGCIQGPHSLFGVQTAGSFFEVDSNGSVTSVFPATTTWNVDGSTHSIRCVSPRDWPKVAVMRTQLDGRVLEFYYGNAFLEGSVVKATKIETIATIGGIGIAGDMGHFSIDGPTWAATYYYRVGSSNPPHAIFAINGPTVVHAIGAAGGNAQDFHNSTFRDGTLHVCYPPAGDANSYVAICRGDGTTLEMYKGGSLLWSIVAPRPCAPVNSSDRWVYVAGEWARGQVPNSILEPLVQLGDPPAQYDPHYIYMIRHDGTQAIPGGQLSQDVNSQFMQNWPWPDPATRVNRHIWSSPFVGFGGTRRGPFHDVVKQSALIGDSLPADFTGLV